MDKVITTRQKILNESALLFSQNGYKATSVRMIARAVGVKESALYNHFENKEHIYKEVLSSIMKPVFSLDSSDITTQALKGKLFLSSFATKYKLMTFDRGSDESFRLLLIELLQNPTLREHFLEDSHGASLKYLSMAFFTMMQNNLIRSTDPNILAYQFFSTLFYIRLHITLMRLDHKNSNDLSRLFEKHVEVFWELIVLS